MKKFFIRKRKRKRNAGKKLFGEIDDETKGHKAFEMYGMC
jgi:hypothetical protein